ncbi:MAG: D-2-hydroxyacid dehydrogenase [Betaproteobacteria bacterium]|nr:D-2-hydroxyacid dehydrogenase [Betaproteobacteria bacterium]
MRKIRVHVENLRARPGIYHVTPERWSAACARHRAQGRRIEASFGWDGETLEDALKDAEIVIGLRSRLGRLAERAPRLKWLHATLAGVDRLFPLDWLPPGAVLTNNHGAHGVKAEQYMHMAYTMLNTRMAEIAVNQHARRWRQVFSPSIIGKTALVVGLGDLGQAAVRAAKKLGLRVVGVSRSGKRVPGVDTAHKGAALDRLLPAADYVVMAVPLTPDTRNLLNRARLDLLKPAAGVINIARAQVLDYDALAGKLGRGELTGAVVDVVDPEPLPPESPLWETPNLIITPHISCDDGEHYVDISLDLWFANFARFLEGKPLRNRVDPRRGY